MSNPDELYTDLLKKTLSFSLWPEPPMPYGYFNQTNNTVKRRLIQAFAKLLERRGLVLGVTPVYTDAERQGGETWPGYADTMVGMKRLDNLEMCVRRVIADGVPGDMIETGVWRGGSCILMRALLKSLNVTDRRVFVADSFEGLPAPDAEKYPADAGDLHHKYSFLAVTEEQVKQNFRRYGLLDDKVVFLKGFFADTLPTAPIEKLSILRLDGDMYSSTIDALNSLYPKLQAGGFCIVDDYMLPGCQKAIHDYRAEHGIDEEMVQIDNLARYWRKEP